KFLVCGGQGLFFLRDGGGRFVGGLGLGMVPERGGLVVCVAVEIFSYLVVVPGDYIFFRFLGVL
ncbi:hypothetical protein, partial [Enterobacter sichuanensis]